jgi:hypothetical protein
MQLEHIHSITIHRHLLVISRVLTLDTKLGQDTVGSNNRGSGIRHTLIEFVDFQLRLMLSRLPSFEQKKILFFLTRVHVILLHLLTPQRVYYFFYPLYVV